MRQSFDNIKSSMTTGLVEGCKRLVDQQYASLTTSWHGLACRGVGAVCSTPCEPEGVERL